MLEWSRAAWRRHVPDVEDIDAFVNGLGDGTIHELAHASALADPDKPALRIGDESVTHGELDAMAARFGKTIKRGERVLLAAPPSIEWAARYLGIFRAGAVAVPANPAYTAAELDAVVEASRSASWEERTGPDAVALVAFTSGTTGKPKPVPLTHRNLLTSIRAAMAAWRWSADDVLVHALPLFHQHGLGGLHATLIAGSTLRVLPRFDSEQLLHALGRATLLFAVPTMYQRLEGDESPNRLRLCVSGSAPLGGKAYENAVRVLGQGPLVRYGTTESGLDTSQPYDERNAETVGIPLPGVELRFGGDGEILLRGPQVSAAHLRDGWFHTGDIGRLDEVTGHLLIDGRSKEMIITGGMKVYPREVEMALETHPDVAEAAVAGVASERWGEQVTAWVVVKPGATFDAEALIEHASVRLAPYKRPKEIRRLDSLPRNHVGKIDRRELLSR